VDKAEEESDLAMAINGTAPGILAEEAKRLSAAIIHYSTDYVFDGSKNTPYTEEDAPNPINVYGRTKLAGEQAIQAVGAPHLIFRTSWVYGTRGKNFLLTILRLARERDELKIVNDQIGYLSRTIVLYATVQVGATSLPQGRMGPGRIGPPSDGSGSDRGSSHLSYSKPHSWLCYPRSTSDTYYDPEISDTGNTKELVSPAQTASEIRPESPGWKSA
jgi:dTDP-4-dehydrorhamnose reductase